MWKKWLYRIGAGVLAIFVVLPVLFPLAIIAAGLYMLVDLIMHIIPGRMGVNSGGVAKWLRRLWQWPIAMVEYAAFGGREFPWLPSDA